MLWFVVVNEGLFFGYDGFVDDDVMVVCGVKVDCVLVFVDMCFGVW